MNFILEIVIIAVIEGALIVWVMEKVPRLEAWLAGFGERRTLNKRLKHLKTEAKATTTVKHLVECGLGSCGMTNRDWTTTKAYLDGVEHDLQLQINDVRSRR